MGFLDKVKDTATKAAEKVQQAAEAGQEKLEEHKSQKRISELKEELGGIVYAQRAGNPSEDAEAETTRIVAEIRSAEAELEQARTEAAAPETQGAPPADESDA